MKTITFYLIFTILLLTSCNTKTKLPKLVVFISVDQLSEDMFNHYSDLYRGGYKWMIDNGVWLTNMHHEHRYTTTGPGHFVLGSGQHPYRGGVIGNYYYHRELGKKVYCIDDTLAKEIETGKKSHSYRQVYSSALGDWLKAEYPESKVYSVSGKDRAAILMGGKNPDLAIWYNWRGKFISSDYYADEYPNWLVQYNGESNFFKYRDTLWTRELDEAIYQKYTRTDYFVGEIDTYDKDVYSPIFPIGFDVNPVENGDIDHEGDTYVADHMGDTPWLDYETIQLAKIILQQENLGKDKVPDILFIGLSGTDVIGHNQGPFSHEGMDNQLKIDKYLNGLFQEINDLIGLEEVLFVLTADHGTIPLPEYLTEYKGLNSGRISRDELKEAYDNIKTEITNKFGDKVYVRDGRNFYYDLYILKERNIEKTKLDDIIRKHMDEVQGIGLILTKDEIQNGDPNNKIIRRCKNFLDPVLSPDIIAIPQEYWTTRAPLGATHGTPYSYDSNVPFVIAQKGKTISKISDAPYATVDIAPTVAKILGVEPLDKVDGKPIF